MLVVGLGGFPLRSDGSVSRQLTRAEVLNEAGADIRIVSEDVFLELTGNQERRPPKSKRYTLEQVCDLLNLDATTLVRWEAQGLIASEGGHYDFRDIVSLRTIAELVGRGVKPQQIALSVRGLASVLPDIDRPLAQLKIVEESGALLAELGDTLMAPDGQLVLNYRVGSDADSEGSDRFRLSPGHSLSTDEWFDRGTALEEEARYEEAIDAYRHAVSRRDHDPVAHFNLGNVLRAADHLDAAEEQYALAVTQDPQMSAAWYNLADVLEEIGRIEDAIACLEAALEALPSYADAHYNIAVLYEEAHRPDDAARHWKAYLRLDPQSPWAERAHRHLHHITST